MKFRYSNKIVDSEARDFANYVVSCFNNIFKRLKALEEKIGPTPPSDEYDPNTYMLFVSNETYIDNTLSVDNIEPVI